MTWHASVVTALERNDIDLVAYLPDSATGALVDAIEDTPTLDTVRVAREEEAIGILSGAWLGGRRGALVCQTSGLANTFNALGSVAVPDGLPFLGLVTRRGDLDDHNLAQAPAGYAMPRLLDDVGVRNHRVESAETVGTYIDLASKTAFGQQTPYVLLLEATLFGGYL